MGTKGHLEDLQRLQRNLKTGERNLRKLETKMEDLEAQLHSHREAREQSKASRQKKRD